MPEGYRYSKLTGWRVRYVDLSSARLDRLMGTDKRVDKPARILDMQFDCLGLV